LAGDPDLGKDTLEHVARGVLGNAKPLGRMLRRNAGPDHGGDPCFAKREAKEIAHNGGIRGLVELLLDHEHDRARVRQELLRERWLENRQKIDGQALVGAGGLDQDRLGVGCHLGRLRANGLRNGFIEPGACAYAADPQPSLRQIKRVSQKPLGRRIGEDHAAQRIQRKYTDADPRQRLAEADIRYLRVEQPDGEPQGLFDMTRDGSQVLELRVGKLRLELRIALHRQHHADMGIRRDRNGADIAQAMLVEEFHAAGMLPHRLVKADMTIGKRLAAEEIAELLRADGLDVSRRPAIGLVVELRRRKRFRDDGPERPVIAMPDQDGADITEIVGDGAKPTRPVLRLRRGIVDRLDRAQQEVIG
jgi:hypothetical protein